MPQKDMGVCESCNYEFAYRLVHNGFNESAFAYCDSCGSTAILSQWYEHIPAGANLKVHGPINKEAEMLLAPCECGGVFRASAHPRCPNCRSELSATAAKTYIEANAPGTAKGWRWQDSWDGVYCVVIEGRLASDVWA